MRRLTVVVSSAAGLGDAALWSVAVVERDVGEGPQSDRVVWVSDQHRLGEVDVSAAVGLLSAVIAEAVRATAPEAVWLPEPADAAPLLWGWASPVVSAEME